MTTPFTTLNVIALALYLAAAVCYGAELFLGAPDAPSASSRDARLTAGARILLLLGAATQFVATGVWCVTLHRSPFAGEFGTLSVLAWIIALAYFGFDIRFRLPAVGAVALPLACIVLFWGLLHMRAPVADAAILESQIVSLHVLSILASYALFALAFGCASLYLVQNRLLKSHRFSSLLRHIPPLATLDKVAYHAVAYALPLLTLGLALGIVYMLHSAVAAPAGRWLLDPHNVVSFATWLLYVLYLAARLAMGWRGIKLQYILVVGLVVALALYVLPTSTHRFGPAQPASTAHL